MKQNKRGIIWFLFHPGTIVTILILNAVLVLFAQHSRYPNSANFINTKTQQEILNDIGFDRTVLLTLVALERNYQLRKRFLPGIHVDDYYLVVLNTTKRIALADTAVVRLPVVSAKKDSTKEQENGRK